MCDGAAANVDGQCACTGAPNPHAPRQWIYRNLTPWRIDARFRSDGSLLPRCPDGKARDVSEPGCGKDVVKVLSIPALGEVKVPREDSCQYNTLDMRRLGQIEVRPAPSELLSNLPRGIVIFGWLAVAMFFGAWALFFGGAGALPWAWVVAAVVVVPVVALVAATVREIRLYQRFDRYRMSLIKRAAALNAARSDGQGHDQSLEGVERGGRIRSFVDGVPRHVAEVTILIGAVVVSVIGLGVAVHLTTQLYDLLPIDYGELVRLGNPFEGVTELALSSPAFWQLLVGHVAQWVLVAIAALAPAAMYFQFDRQRLGAVQRRWVQEVFRLDPTVRTVRDIEAKYGSQIESSFGDLGPDSGLRLGSGRRSPVIVATILLVVGWFLVISTTSVPELVEVPITSAVGGGSGGSVLEWPDGSFPVATFFWPDLSLVGYAFLGAYVFTLFHVLRGYQRRDLHAKSYNTIVVRILAAYALALVVGLWFTGSGAEVALFFVGLTPESALVWLREKISGDGRFSHLVPLSEPAPLTDLEGIDLYDRTRLAEEGINNVQALAHADIVELMSSTRISAAQLVDWTDQAILYLRVGGDLHAKPRGTARAKSARHEPQPEGAAPSPATASTGSGGDTASPSGIPPDVHANLAHLRSYGIRTATDLLQAYEQAARRGGTDQAASDAEVEALRAALELPSSPRNPRVYSIQTIIDTLTDEEWFVQVRNWRSPEFGAFDSWYSYLDGHNWELQCPKDLPTRVQDALRPLAPVAMASTPRDSAGGLGDAPTERPPAPGGANTNGDAGEARTAQLTPRQPPS